MKKMSEEAFPEYNKSIEEQYKNQNETVGMVVPGSGGEIYHHANTSITFLIILVFSTSSYITGVIVTTCQRSKCR